MSSSETREPRRRLSREDRQRQLLDVAWQLVRDEGTEGLTLGRLAEQAGVTKPVVYDHFNTRSGLLVALYEDFDSRQSAVMEATWNGAEATLDSMARVIARSYVDCVLVQGREIPGVIAALGSSPELEKVKARYQAVFLDKCRTALAPFTGSSLTRASLRAMLGAAEALSHAATTDEISAEQAQDELYANIVAMVERSARHT